MIKTIKGNLKLKIITGLFLAVTILFAAANRVTAELTQETYSAYITIGGIDYGSLGQFHNISQYFEKSSIEGTPLMRFSRNIITEKSLYDWAASQIQYPAQADINLIVRDSRGYPVTTFTLKALPLTFKKEANEPAGGYHEEVTVAVRETMVL